jgi:hypothetical protein
MPSNIAAPEVAAHAVLVDGDGDGDGDGWSLRLRPSRSG